MYFSSKIKEERQKHNMSQQQLGEKLNISRQSISKWERGESYPSIELLIKLSDIFDITLDELVKEDNFLKEKLIKDSQKLAHPRWKLFFDPDYSHLNSKSLRKVVTTAFRGDSLFHLKDEKRIHFC